MAAREWQVEVEPPADSPEVLGAIEAARRHLLSWLIGALQAADGGGEGGHDTVPAAGSVRSGEEASGARSEPG